MKTESTPPSASLLISLDTILEPLDIAKLFSRPQPLHIELGAGDGSFLTKYAALHPELNFIGVERLLGRLRKIDRKGRRAGLANMRGVRIEAAYFLEHLLPKNSAAALHIYFPDPWPKRKHRKHRLVNPGFPDLALKALIPGGFVYLRTDDADYFAQMGTVFQGASAYVQVPTPAPLSEVVTDFERNFLACGIQTLRSAWQLSNG